MTLPVQVSVFGKTDLGRTREHNEDTFLVADLSTGNASLHPEVRQHKVGPRGSLFMVADGMGGAAAGELASAMAADLIYRHMATVWAADEDASADRLQLLALKREGRKTQVAASAPVRLDLGPALDQLGRRRDQPGAVGIDVARGRHVAALESSD